MMKTKVKLRPEKPVDFEFLRNLYASTRWEEVSQTGWPEDQIRWFLSEQFDHQCKGWAQDYAKAERNIILVDGKKMGRLYLDRWEKEIRIIDIALLPEVRGKGIGGKLLKKIFQEGRSTQKKISIHVEQVNRAKNLYKRMGFVKVGEHGIYERMEWTPS